MLSSDECFKETVHRDQGHYLRKLSSSSVFNPHPFQALLDIGVNIQSTDSFNRTCIDVCVTAEAAAFISPLLDEQAVRSGCRSAIRNSRSQVLAILLKRIQIDDKLVEYAVQLNEINCMQLLFRIAVAQYCGTYRVASTNSDRTVLSKLWLQACSREAAMLLVKAKCPLAMGHFKHVDVLEVALTHSPQVALDQTHMQLMIDGDRPDLVLQYSDHLPRATNSMLVELASKDDLVLLRLLFQVESLSSIAKAASIHGALQCLNWLLDTHSVSLSSEPLIAYACTYANLDAVKYMMSRGVSPLILHSNGQCALHALAAAAGDAIGNCKASADYKSLAAILLCECVDVVDCQDERGRSPLMVAVTESNWYMVEALLNSGANASLRDEEGLSIMDYAVRQDAVLELNKYISP